MSKHNSYIDRIKHILEAIEKIQSYVSNMNENDFYDDGRTMQAVERNFEIIGEAARHVPDNIREKYPNIEWLDMRDMRNFISHQYNEVEEHVLWNTVQKDLPPLLVKIKKMLKEIE